MQYYPTLIAALSLCTGALALTDAQADGQRRVAVTFDDLPVVAVSKNDASTRRMITTGLLQSLTAREIPAIGFVNEGKFTHNGEIDDDQIDLLRLWLLAGLALGNHSFSHTDLHRAALSDFQEDVLRGELVTRSLLAERGLQPEFFRHPYLHTGRDLETKLGFETFLAQHDYRVAPVSIDNSEWIFARAYVLAIEAGDTSLAEQIGIEYVQYMLDIFDFYESQSKILFERNIAQVLLVHANELNSVWFGVFADRLAGKGYEFISLAEALRDPAYESPDTYTGPAGISWLHRWAITRNVDPKTMQGEPETPGHILKLTGLPQHLNPTSE